jgi:hypothetical protein
MISVLKAYQKDILVSMLTLMAYRVAVNWLDDMSPRTRLFRENVWIGNEYDPCPNAGRIFSEAFAATDPVPLLLQVLKEYSSCSVIIFSPTAMQYIKILLVDDFSHLPLWGWPNTLSSVRNYEPFSIKS